MSRRLRSSGDLDHVVDAWLALVSCRRRWCGILRKGKTCLIEIDVTRDYNPLGHWIVAFVATLIEWVSEENASCRTWCELMWRGCSGVGIAKAAKDAEVGVLWRCTEQELIGRGVCTRATWSVIKQVCGHCERIRPERKRCRGLKQKGTQAIILRA